MEIVRKYKKELIIVASALLVSLLALIIFANRKIGINQFETDNYRVTYDSTWKRTTSEPLNLVLEHITGSTINFDIYNLEEDFRFMSFLNLVNEIEFAVRTQNENHELIARQEVTVTKNNYEGYQILYETEENSVLVVIAQKGEQVLTITYQASMEDFDLLLDSVQEIVYNFELISMSFELAERVSDINFKTLSLYKGGIDVSGRTKSQIANFQFLVEYEVPNNFTRTIFNSMLGSYEYRDQNNGSIQIRTSILPNNIYRYIDGLENLWFRKAALANKSLNETYSKISDTKYVYNARYSTESLLSETVENEVIHIIYALDHRRTFLIEITARNMRIPASVFENTEMVSSRKIALNIVRNIENGMLRNEMKVMLDSRNGRHNTVMLYTPEIYYEYESNFMPRSKYEERIFRHYRNDRDYDIEIKYYFNRLANRESHLNSLQEIWFKNAPRQPLGIRTYNDKEFTVYRFDFVSDDGQNQVFVLIYEFEGTVLITSIRGVNRQISEEEILELTNFDMKKIEN